MGAQDGEREVNRVELVAALLEYDDEPADDFGKALTSAILTPYRHILLPPSKSSPRQNQPEYNDFDDYFQAVTLEEKERPSAEDEYQDVQARYARSVLERGERELADEERLTAEWGLREHLSQLGSGSDMGDYAVTTSPEQETRSLPDLMDRRMSTFSTASTSALDTTGATATRLRILESRPRSRSLGQITALVLPEFDDIPSLLSPDDNGIPLARPRPRRPSTLENGIARPRPRSRAMSSNSRRLSVASIATILSRQEFDATDRPYTAGRRPSSNERRSSYLSGGGGDRNSALLDDEPLSESVSAVEWTSRFDPQMLVLARQGEKDRAVFAKEHSGTPNSLIMPTPLAGQARTPFKRTRTEGPEIVVPRTQEEQEELEILEAQKNVRPAGALFGRSLMDVMAEKQAELKAKQRHYVPGNDGRRSMMDWGKPQPMHVEDELLVSDAASEKGLAPPKLPRGKSTLSIFGPDLFYARDLEKLREMERVEAEENEAEATKEADMWEKERLKAEKKQTNKMRKAAERKLGGKDTAESPVLERPSHHRTHSTAPSLALSTALHDQEVDTTNWFAPPSPESSTSSLPRRRGDSRRNTYAALSPTDAANRQQPVLVTQSPKQHEAHLRAAVMHGSLSASEAVGRMGTYQERRSMDGDDQRLYGEQFFSRGYEAKGLQTGVNLDSKDRRFGSMSMEERHDLSGLGYTPPAVEEEEDDDDDVPLGVRHPEARGRIDEDDMPLAFSHLSGGNQPEDEDDHPLGFVHPAAAYAQHQHQQEQQLFHSHQQQQQFYSQQAMMMQQFQMQQSYEQQMMSMQGGMEMGGGNGDSVARWRQGIRSTSRQS